MQTEDKDHTPDADLSMRDLVILSADDRSVTFKAGFPRTIVVYVFLAAGIISIFIWRSTKSEFADAVSTCALIITSFGIAVPKLILEIVFDGWQVRDVVRRRRSSNKMSSLVQHSSKINALRSLAQRGDASGTFSTTGSSLVALRPQGYMDFDVTYTCYEAHCAGYQFWLNDEYEVLIKSPSESVYRRLTFDGTYWHRESETEVECRPMFHILHPDALGDYIR